MDLFDSKVRKIISRRFLRDIKNAVLYRSLAPKTNQLIYIDPSKIKTVVEKNSGDGEAIFKRKHSGLVVSGDWDRNVYPIDTHSKINICHLHFTRGSSWEEAGAYKAMHELIEEKGSFDGCVSLDDVRKRYETIDNLFNEIKSSGYLAPRSEIISNNHREYGGILIHIGRSGEPIFSGSGCHRLAIAKALNLKKIPCELGVIHAGALKNIKYKEVIMSKKSSYP
jgi:hypothetical protein